MLLLLLPRLPANVEATKTTPQYEMYRLLEWNKELSKNTYWQCGRVQPQSTLNGAFGYHRATVIPNTDVRTIRADQRLRLPSGLVASCLTD